MLATLGLRLHQAPDPAATVVTVLRPGAQLDATATQTIGGTTWLHVHAHSDPSEDSRTSSTSSLEQYGQIPARGK